MWFRLVIYRIAEEKNHKANNKNVENYITQKAIKIITRNTLTRKCSTTLFEQVYLYVNTAYKIQ